MGFVFQVCGTVPAFDLTEEGGRKILSHYIGHDPDLQRTYFANAMLSYNDNMPEEPEYSCFLAERCTVTGEQITHFDSTFARNVLDSNERQYILSVIAFATIQLLRRFQPPSVFRCILLGSISKSAEAQERAMRKHNFISWAFNQAGYDIIQFDPFNGDRTIIAKLRPTSSSTQS